MLKRSERTARMMDENGRRAMGAMSWAIDKISYELPRLEPEEGFSDQDKMLFYALSIQMEGVCSILDSMVDRLKQEQQPKGIIWNDEWPRKRVRFGK